MDPFEIREALDSFRICVDTREQDTPKARERYKAFGVPFRKQTLAYGDYCGNVTIPGGADLYPSDSVISADCVIERKMSLDELAGCFTRSRDRFRKEFERARDVGARIYLLTEGASWEMLFNHRYRSRFNPEAFKASLVAWSARYGAHVIFCKPETSGRLIREILYREMKERLERGEYG